MNFGSVMTNSRRGWRGSGLLWTQLPPASRLPAAKGPGGLWGAKFPWFRAAPGQVRVSATTAIGSPATFRADVGTVAQYGPTGFTPSVLRFGRLGCWSVTGRLGPDELRVVVLVVPAAVR
jgi:hypothetical protein